MIVQKHKLKNSLKEKRKKEDEKWNLIHHLRHNDSMEHFNAEKPDSPFTLPIMEPLLIDMIKDRLKSVFNYEYTEQKKPDSNR
jgi:hypothetical protein